MMDRWSQLRFNSIKTNRAITVPGHKPARLQTPKPYLHPSYIQARGRWIFLSLCFVIDG